MTDTNSGKSYRPRLIAVAILLATLIASETSAQCTDFRVMSFNVRYSKIGASEAASENNWADAKFPRRERAIHIIHDASPDILGVQEARELQIKDFRDALPEFEFYGIGRDDGKSGGEFSGIFYRKDRFTQIGAGSFWLSATPEKPGTSFYTALDACPRIASWVLLTDKKAHRDLVVLNMHWDHISAPARQKSAALVHDRLAKLGKDLPAIVMGDLNAYEDSREVMELIGANDSTGRKLADSFREVHPNRLPDEASFNDWNGTLQGSRIDFILHTGELTPLSAEIVRTSYDGHWPSDHYPVTATLKLERESLPSGGTGNVVEPRVTNSRYKLELVAKEPEIVTPIGLAFDRKGRLLVVESHTHQRPKEYQGPAGDRIRMLSDSNGDGRLDHWSTFAEGFRHAMNLLVRDDGAIYLVTRHNVVLLRDPNDDGASDKQEEILRLETKDDYPHNGLSGIARQAGDNTLLISMGENHGIPYRLVGSDGKALTGKDGAGTIFRCTFDGGDLRRVAKGFWNPFSMCIVPDGRIFAVDNDPDASPPCRLLHVVWGGDYGFRYEYGRAGTHPLQAWNGELPGTLPMVCGVGEAPTAIVPYAGGLWVTSWGDHRIERYELVPRGASYAAKREVIVQGGADFRPTGMALAPDGSLYFADWVLRDYPVHGHGRIWRLTLPAADRTVAFPRRSTEDLAASDNAGNAVDNAESDDPFVHAHGVWQLAQQAKSKLSKSPGPRLRLGALEAARLGGSDQAESILRQALHDDSIDVRLFAIGWIADERIAALRDDVAKLLDAWQPNARYYLAVLGCIDWLDHKPGLRRPEIAEDLLVRELESERRSPEAHTLALTLLKPDNKFLTLERLKDYLQSQHGPLREEAARSLAQQSNPKRFELLAAAAQDDSQSVDVRAEAIVGLSADAEHDRGVLEKLAAGKDPELRREAERALRLSGARPTPAETKPPASDIKTWQKLMDVSGNAATGRRLFFTPAGARCSVCHMYGGRGGNIGPDLSQIGRSTSRDKIITSILQPSQEIAPDYQAWLLVTIDGKTYTGLRMPKPGDDGTEDYADSAGKRFTLPSTSIEERHAASASIMPDNLQSVLSIDDLRDLVTFLTSENSAP